MESVSEMFSNSVVLVVERESASMRLEFSLSSVLDSFCGMESVSIFFSISAVLTSARESADICDCKWLRQKNINKPTV
jgi:hypothetical protein